MLNVHVLIASYHSLARALSLSLEEECVRGKASEGKCQLPFARIFTIFQVEEQQEKKQPV